MADQYRQSYDDGRGWTDRAGDEVRSWFGDDDAQARREADARREGYYGRGYDRDRGGWSGDRGGWRDRGESTERSSWGDRSNWNDRGGSWGTRGNREPERWRSGSDEQYAPHRVDDDWRGRGNSATARQWRGDTWRDEWYAGPNWGWGERGGEPSRGSWDSGSYGRGGYDDWRMRSGSSSGRMDGGTGRSGGYAGRGPKGYRRSDDRIREDASDRLADDTRVDASEISVEVRDAEVTLTGTVTDREQKRRAEDCVESVSGVRNVINNLRVSQPTQPGESGLYGETVQNKQDDTRTGSSSKSASNR